jgi:hypothetical protein
MLRIHKFIQVWIRSGPALTVACSHGDWLPYAVEIATGARVAFKKGAWAEIELLEADGLPVLRNLIQEPH